MTKLLVSLAIGISSFSIYASGFQVEEYCRAADGQRLFQGLVQLPVDEFTLGSIRSRVQRYSFPGDVSVKFQAILSGSTSDSSEEPNPVAYYQRIGNFEMLTMRGVDGRVERILLKGSNPFAETVLGSDLRFIGEYFGYREEARFCEYGIRGIVFAAEVSALEDLERTLSALRQLEALLPNPGQLRIIITSDLDLAFMTDEMPISPIEMGTRDGHMDQNARKASLFRDLKGGLTLVVKEGTRQVHYERQRFEEPQ